MIARGPSALVGFVRDPDTALPIDSAKVSLVCLPDDARQRLKRLERIGFDEVLVVSPAGALDELERIRDFL